MFIVIVIVVIVIYSMDCGRGKFVLCQTKRVLGSFLFILTLCRYVVRNVPVDTEGGLDESLKRFALFFMKSVCLLLLLHSYLPKKDTFHICHHLNRKIIELVAIITLCFFFLLL